MDVSILLDSAADSVPLPEWCAYVLAALFWLLGSIAVFVFSYCEYFLFSLSDSDKDKILNNDSEKNGDDKKKEITDKILEVFPGSFLYNDGKEIRIAVDEEEDCKLISVSNSGGGIEAEEILHIFDSFYRGSNSEKVEGSGLGLYICKELLKKMDGDIFARKSGGEFIMTVVLRKI